MKGRKQNNKQKLNVDVKNSLLLRTFSCSKKVIH